MKIEFPHQPEAQQPERFPDLDFDDIVYSPLPWRVKNLLPATGVVNVAGPSTAGKTFLVLDMVAKIARGLPVLGHKSKPCGICYVAAEAAAGILTRIDGLKLRTGKLGGAFRLIPATPDLTSPEDVDALKQKLGRIRDQMASRGQTLGVLVIDTMSASTPGADENTAKDMGPVLNALQSMATEFSLLVLVVSHTGKNVSSGIRGWSGQFANADGVIMLDEAHADGTRTGTVAKVKDGVSGQRFAFGLEVIKVGVDADGEDVTTCVVVEADAPKSTKAEGSLTARAKLVYAALVYVLDNGGSVPTPLGPGIPAWAKAATNEAVRKRAYASGLQEDGVKQGTIRARYFRARLQLQDRGFIRIESEDILIWLGKPVAR